MPYRGATEIVKNIKQNKLFGIWIGRFLLSFFLCIITLELTLLFCLAIALFWMWSTAQEQLSSDSDLIFSALLTRWRDALGK